MNNILTFSIPKIEYLYLSIISLVIGMSVVYASYAFFKAFQQRGYKKTGYMAWLYKDNGKYFSRLMNVSLLSFFAYFLFTTLFGVFNEQLVSYLGLTFFVVFLVIFRRSSENKSDRQRLEYTARIKRLIFTTTIIVSLSCFAVMLFMLWFDSRVTTTFFKNLKFALITLLPFFMPLSVVLADWANRPIEFTIKNKFKKKAQEKLSQHKDTITIGITGSFGKTTVKNILTTLLKEKFIVVCSPSSYNTPMGLCKTVLENFNGEQILIAEMGARRVGDIKELARLIPCDIGIVTGVNRQHMESFKNLDNILDTKFELIENLKKGGKGYFNADNDGANVLFERARIEKYKVGISYSQSSPSISNIDVTNDGSDFVLKYNGEEISCHTKLLGEHNISNLLLCVKVAIDFGLTLNEISNGISKLKAVSHRLEIVKSTKEMTVIDDSYNANPHGVKAATNVLKLFSGNKIVVTSGMVELGNMEKYENKKLGELLATSADHVILIGERRAEAIIEGLIFNNFNKENVHICSHILEATEIIKKIATGKDVVLFLNDLPDSYIS